MAVAKSDFRDRDSERTPSRGPAACDGDCDLLRRAFDFLGIGVVVVKSDGHVLEVNSIARNAARRAGLSFDRGMVRLVPYQRDERLAAAIRQSLIAGDAVLTVRRASSTPAVLSLRALRYDVAAIYFVDPRAACRFAHEQLRAAFGLTAAEARVLAGVLEGLDPTRIAEKLNVTIHTVRAHLRNVFTKTGARGQRDAVRITTMVLPCLLPVEKSSE